jgi:hypothetical protein
MEFEHRHHHTVDVHIHIHNDPDPRLDQILAAVTTIKKQETRIMSDVSNLQGELDALTAQVTNSGTVVDSAIVLINGISAQIAAAVAAAQAAGASPEVIAAFAGLGTALDTKATDLSNAMVANTPAAE